jgi:cytochrome c553
MMRSMLSRIALPLFLITCSTAQAEDAAKSVAKADAARGKAIASTVCAACHNADGNSSITANPKLAGQHYDYLVKELKDFKANGDKPAARPSPVMSGMVANLSEDQMRDIAAYFAAQKAANNSAKNKQTIEQGQKLYRAGDMAKGLPACAACHGPAGAGMPAQYPRIAGQHAEYTEAQLKAFRDGTRANDPNKMMRMVALKMTDAEIKAVADYIAGLR